MYEYLRDMRMTYRIQAYRYARKAGRVCRVITSSARAETAEQAEAIRRVLLLLFC